MSKDSSVVRGCAFCNTNGNLRAAANGDNGHVALAFCAACRLKESSAISVVPKIEAGIIAAESLLVGLNDSAGPKGRKGQTVAAFRLGKRQQATSSGSLLRDSSRRGVTPKTRKDQTKMRVLKKRIQTVKKRLGEQQSGHRRAVVATVSGKRKVTSKAAKAEPGSQLEKNVEKFASVADLKARTDALGLSMKERRPKAQGKVLVRYVCRHRIRFNCKVSGRAVVTVDAGITFALKGQHEHTATDSACENLLMSLGEGSNSSKSPKKNKQSPSRSPDKTQAAGPSAPRRAARFKRKVASAEKTICKAEPSETNIALVDTRSPAKVNGGIGVTVSEGHNDDNGVLSDDDEILAKTLQRLDPVTDNTISSPQPLPNNIPDANILQQILGAIKRIEADVKVVKAKQLSLDARMQQIQRAQLGPEQCLGQAVRPTSADFAYDGSIDGALQEADDTAGSAAFTPLSNGPFAASTSTGMQSPSIAAGPSTSTAHYSTLLRTSRAKKMRAGASIPLNPANVREAFVGGDPNIVIEASEYEQIFDRNGSTPMRLLFALVRRLYGDERLCSMSYSGRDGRPPLRFEELFLSAVRQTELQLPGFVFDNAAANSFSDRITKFRKSCARAAKAGVEGPTLLKKEASSDEEAELN